MKKIKIPKRFKKAIEERWNLKNAKLIKSRNKYSIKKSCVLCSNYTCWDCPFGVRPNGCVDFIDELKEDLLMPLELYHDKLEWDKIDDKGIRKSVREFKKEARKYIESS